MADAIGTTLGERQESHESAFMRERGAIFSSGIGLARLALQDGDAAKALKYLDDACAEVHEAWWKALLADGYTEPLIWKFIGKREAPRNA